ncbi:MAG TPA: hypothetical protein VFV58_19645 [Blastocatellia bacterium]|nr:hypothetical protein [Blastocatellia bacterium]
MVLVNKQGNILSFDHSRRNSGAIVDRDRSETSTSQPSKPLAYNLKNVPTEVDKRRAELATLARAAEARAKEAEQKCEQAEGRLEQELKERMLAERRLKELEENRLRQQHAILIEGPQARTATWAQGGNGTWLKEADTRAKEAEAEIQTLMVALMEAEQKRAKAESLAQAAGDKARELELEAETAKVALAEANQKIAEAEAAARVSEEKARTIESLIVEAEAAGRQATERYQHIEAELEYEATQRAAAEQKLKEFEDELSSYLELDWSKGQPDLTRAVVVRESGGTDEVISQFQAQVEAERRGRREAEDARAALDHKVREMERALRIAEENNRQIAALNLATSDDENQTYTVKKRKGFKYELKFIIYGMAIALLLVVLFALVATVFLQM